MTDAKHGETMQGPMSYGHWIAGRETHSGGASFPSHNPTTGAEWGRFALGSQDTVGDAVAAATAAFEGAEWSSLSPTRRGRLMMRWGDAIAQHAEKLGALETSQNGKLLSEMVLQARIVPDWLYYYGGLADKIEGRVIPVERRSVLNYTRREALGVVGVIMPWNSPLFLTTMAVAPALAAGNTVVIKPSEVSSASIIEAVKLAEQIGFPRGVLNVVTGGRETAEALIDHCGVAKIAFTGGVEAGRAVGVRAARRMAQVTLELGGKSANIVFPDADLAQARAGLLAGIFAAAGQTCVAGSRAFVHRSIHDRLLAELAERAKNIRIGNPLDPATQMGPVATKAQLDKDESMVRRAIDEGAQVVHGGCRAAVDGFPGGYFYTPTILTGVSPGSYIAQNEVFGPVLSVIPFDDEDEVIALANGTGFGLAAGIWSLNIRQAHRVANQLQAGTVWVNMYRAMSFNSPFGGYKASGIGRQNGIEAIDSYLQTKSIWCELSQEVQDPFVMRA
ncbi:aldehyde dehydrogenase [Verminephrobacter eiseniae]|uniref:aldehyde dehydrogenase n=1 Tax=Verminephrobacter eiseniae TaxID=364317 RepID=UPI002237E198|nr:aldehyde dehydrogenase [Verminephrobacter eiseniae]MCW5234074.1 aldehyde dehydrogenase [Verminephrobacter eiseniae]